MIHSCFRHSIKMEHQKIINLLDTTSDNVPKLITKKYISSGSLWKNIQHQQASKI